MVPSLTSAPESAARTGLGATTPWGPDAALALAVLGAAAVHAASQSATGPVFPVDDAYITLHNARVLLSGAADPSYAGASPLAGATSPAHLALVAAFGLVLEPAWALLASL